MSCWHYAQLTIIVDGRAPQPGKRTIVWHGPGHGVGGLAGDLGRTDLEDVDLDRGALGLMICMSRAEARASISRLRR